MFTDLRFIDKSDHGGESPLSRSTIVFTALHVMQTRSSDENSVSPSVCLSVCLSHA